MNKTGEALDDISNHIQNMEVVRVKEGLWKLAIEFLINKYDIKDNSIFTQIDEFEKLSMELCPESLKPAIQDAVNEFKAEYNDIGK